MGKSNTEVKIMRVDSKAFEKLEAETIKHNKTFKVKKEEQVNKIYFVHFDEQENLHFIGKHSHTGVIDKAALMREIPEDQNSSQINSHLVALIDREIALKNEFRLSIFETLLVIAATILCGLVGIGAYFTASLILANAIPLGLYGLLFGGLGSYLTIWLVDSIFESPNSPGVRELLLLTANSIIVAGGAGCFLGTLVAPGVGTLIGAGIGAALCFSISTVLVIVDYVRKKADNPVVIQQLTESLSINEPLGLALKAKERKFSSIIDKHYYGEYVGQYKKLFPAVVKEIKGIEKEEAHNENLDSTNLVYNS
ncbi:MAG: hypothetical protein H0U73_12575 [Tatlockia sp.]|nr:hypothetical protein [Tatlockia sp.]